MFSNNNKVISQPPTPMTSPEPGGDLSPDDGPQDHAYEVRDPQLAKGVGTVTRVSEVRHNHLASCSSGIPGGGILARVVKCGIIKQYIYFMFMIYFIWWGEVN